MVEQWREDNETVMTLGYKLSRTMGLIALVLALSGAGSAADAGIFNPQTFTLANGMQVVVVPNHRVPVVNHMVWYKVGSADDPPGKSGIAHFLEHLMFKGTKTLASGEFSRRVARNGGRENAFTSTDYTGYFQTVAVDRLELVMGMEADRMTNLVLTEEEVRTERLVILEERRQRTDNDPAAILSEHVSAALYINHPYRVPVIGWEHEIKGLDRDSILSFYRQRYAPNNAILVVSGDITADRLRPLAEKYYGAIPRAPTPPRVRPQEPPHRAARSVVLEDARVRQPSWSRSYLAPSYSAGATEHAYPMQVLAQILGGGATSRLYRTLVVERKLATSAGAYYGPDRLGPSSFSVYASPLPGIELDVLQKAVEEQLERLLMDGIGSDEVERAKSRMQSRAIYARDSLRAGGRILGSALAAGRTIEDAEAWPERIGAVTVKEIDAAARAVLRDGHSVTGRLLPEGKPNKERQRP
jgi:zinc protease